MIIAKVEVAGTMTVMCFWREASLSVKEYISELHGVIKALFMLDTANFRR